MGGVWGVRHAYRTVIRSRPTALQKPYLAGVEIGILGPIEAHVDGEALPLGGLRERALLALLALSPGCRRP